VLRYSVSYSVTTLTKHSVFFYAMLFFTQARGVYKKICIFFKKSAKPIFYPSSTHLLPIFYPSSTHLLTIFYLSSTFPLLFLYFSSNHLLPLKNVVSSNHHPESISTYPKKIARQIFEKVAGPRSNSNQLCHLKVLTEYQGYRLQ